jgi:hypothetical protein
VKKVAGYWLLVETKKNAKHETRSNQPAFAKASAFGRRSRQAKQAISNKQQATSNKIYY